jgi:hypothetical protein
MIELMNGVWRGEGFPIEWREGVISPIYKKDEKNKSRTLPRNNCPKYRV